MHESRADFGEPEWSERELEEITSCAGCGSKQLVVRYEGLEDLLGGVQGRWGFLACVACGSLHLNPRPVPDAIHRAYPSDYVTHNSASNANMRDNGASWMWRMANGYLNSRFGSTREPFSKRGRWVLPLLYPVRQQLDYFYRHLPGSPGRLLDVGCGNGAFLQRARAAGWAVQGIEPDPAAASKAKEEGLDIVACSINAFAPAVPFDRITLSHVFEHLHDPVEALQCMREWLRPEGVLWMSMPNSSGLGRRLFGRNWFSLDPPRHIFLPTPSQVAEMLKAAGYQDIRFLRRGRGARSSILPSVDYARRRGRKPLVGGAIVAFAIDILGSWSPVLSEEIVVTAKRGC